MSVCFLADEAGGELRRTEETLDARRFRRIPDRMAFDHRSIHEDAGLR